MSFTDLREGIAAEFGYFEDEREYQVFEVMEERDQRRRQKKREAKRWWYWRNIDACRAHARQYYWRNRDRMLANAKAWREANLERCRAQQKRTSDRLNERLQAKRQRELWERKPLGGRVCSHCGCPSLAVKGQALRWVCMACGRAT